MPIQQYLKKRYRAILHQTGYVLLIVGVIMLTPLFALIKWPEEIPLIWGFLIPSGLLLAIGFGLRRFFESKEVDLDLREGGVIVVLSWIVVCIASACPFIILEKMNFTQAIFEAVSGWTTTGLSVINFRETSHVILLWRSIMQFAGGAGLAIIMLSAVAGPEGPALSRAEGRAEQLVPNIKQSSKIVLTLYLCYASAGTLAYKVVGLSFFDSINHAFCAVSTGGFSTYPESVRYWDSVAIEAVTLALMILGSLHFATAWGLMHGHVRTVTKSGELRLMAFLIVVAFSLIFIFTTYNAYGSMGLSIRIALFQTVTALTTTGFSTIGYDVWNPIGFFVIILLMIIGGGACSTSGGLKQYRVYSLFKSFVWDMKMTFSPRRTVVHRKVYFGQKEVVADDPFLRSIGTFFFVYLSILAIGTIVILTQGHGPQAALFEFASCLGTAGLSVGITSADASKIVLWTEICGMFIGRLEIFAVVVSIAKIGKDSLDIFRPKRNN
jgi:trk system potassium uptake protein